MQFFLVVSSALTCKAKHRCTQGGCALHESPQKNLTNMFIKMQPNTNIRDSPKRTVQWCIYVRGWNNNRETGELECILRNILVNFIIDSFEMIKNFINYKCMTSTEKFSGYICKQKIDRNKLWMIQQNQWEASWMWCFSFCPFHT